VKAKAVEAVKFCESGSTLKKEAGSGSKLGSKYLHTVLEAEAKNILLLPHLWLIPNRSSCIDACQVM